MKKAVKKIRRHARKHRDLLEARWEETGFTWGQAEQIIKRIDGIIEQLPTAEKQAHERIIGGRQVKSSDKILSLYEPEAQVIVKLFMIKNWLGSGIWLR